MGIDPVTHEPLKKEANLIDQPIPESDQNKNNGHQQVQVVPECTSVTAAATSSELDNSSSSTSSSENSSSITDESKLVLNTLCENDPLLRSLLEADAPLVDSLWELPVSSEEQKNFDNMTSWDDSFNWLLDCQDFGIHDFGFDNCFNDVELEVFNTIDDMENKQ